jgi:hypothetical protein
MVTDVQSVRCNTDVTEEPPTAAAHGVVTFADPPTAKASLADESETMLHASNFAEALPQN